MKQSVIEASAWLLFYSLIIVSWLALWIMATDSLLPISSVGQFAESWRSLCISANNADPFALILMWAVMSSAMMLPTLVPALKSYHNLNFAGASSLSGFLLLLAGYLLVWFGFALIAAWIQGGLGFFNLLTPDGQSLSYGLNGLLFLLAGGYQFSSFKQNCLSQCQSPLMFFMQYWRPGLRNAISLGVRLGIICLGCCWALMLLAFAGGVMNIAWMFLATLLMTFEKLPQIGETLTRPLGVLLLFFAISFFWLALQPASF